MIDGSLATSPAGAQQLVDFDTGTALTGGALVVGSDLSAQAYVASVSDLIVTTNGTTEFLAPNTSGYPNSGTGFAVVNVPFSQAASIDPTTLTYSSTASVDAAALTNETLILHTNNAAFGGYVSAASQYVAIGDAINVNAVGLPAYTFDYAFYS